MHAPQRQVGKKVDGKTEKLGFLMSCKKAGSDVMCSSVEKEDGGRVEPGKYFITEYRMRENEHTGCMIKLKNNCGGSSRGVAKEEQQLVVRATLGRYSLFAYVPQSQIGKMSARRIRSSTLKKNGGVLTLVLTGEPRTSNLRNMQRHFLMFL